MGRARDTVVSEEAAATPATVVEPTARGARALAASYWREIEATTHGLVRVTARDGRVELKLLRRGPTLIELGVPSVAAGTERVSCSFPIVGGLLVGRPGGALSLEQVAGATVVLRSRLTGYSPRLAGALYTHVQARLHSLVSRRFFARLMRETA